MVLVVKDKTKQILAAVESVTKSSVYVGIPATKAERTDDAPIGNAAIGYIQEHGAPENNLPARPFLIPGVKAVRAKVAAIFKRAGQSAIEGRTLDVERGLNAAGMVAQVAVKKVITDGIPPPLSEGTLEKRRARGVTRETPLIDTGQLLNSITYVIRRR